MPSKRKIHIALLVLLVVSVLIRGFIAGFIELGNDEVYYWTYAKYPALSHFDHPPMVGFVIDAFTLNLTFEDEFFVRLGSVVLGTLSTYLMFLIGLTVKNHLTGLYAALLYTASFYGFILTGTFILPDTPQVFFWLLTLYLLLKSLPDRERSPRNRNLVFFAGATAGLALLSKYHSVFLIFGMLMYILFYDRKWILTKEFWGSLLVSALLFLPVIFWNIENNFISFTFHENRVGITESGLQPQYFLTEIAGQFFYNNPVNVVLILISLFALIRRRHFISAPYRQILLWTSLPLIAVFTAFSLFRSTLPHWTGPGYLGLLIIVASWLSEPSLKGTLKRLIPLPVIFSMLLLGSVITLAVGQIRGGWIPLQKMKIDDVSLDLYGWKQLGEKFAPLKKWDEDHFLMDKDAPIITFRWFPAANFEYYLGRPTHLPVYAIGSLERIHKYYWINKINGNLKQGDDMWFIALSDDYEDPVQLYGNLFDLIVPSDTISIIRGMDTVRKAFIFRMIDLNKPLIFTPPKVTGRVDPAKTDTLAYFLKLIRGDRQYLDFLEKKSVREKVPLEDLIREEAMKLVRQSKESGVVPDTGRVR
ncbi:MAG: glycosyltransferase family 39 protein [Alphaproteobacteria bacterium]|nr:glycosyltransferase family 39 protein [Alphaproteobacteria bacterium]